MMKGTRSSTVRGALLAAALVLGSAHLAGAGVVDSATPTLSVGGSSSRHVYTIPGVIRNNNLETVFVCTSLENVNSFRFAVEVFAATGGAPLNNAGIPSLNGADTLAPGETRTVGTDNTVGIHEDTIITGLAAASLRNGSARIVSESTRIVCNAWVVDELGNPPASSLALKVMKARKQSGD